MANKNFKARIGIEAPLIAADNGTTAITLSDNDVTVVGDLTITSNTIKSSTGATAISLSSDDVTVADRLFVVGNIIGSNGGYTALTFNQNDVTVEGDLTVTGNDIKSSSATAITLSGANVTVAGTLEVDGNQIKASDGTTALTLSATTGNVAVSGDLAVNGATSADITTTTTTASVFNTTATTVNAFGAATTTNIGAKTGSSIINGTNRFTSPIVYGFLGGATSSGRGYMQSNGNTGSFSSARNNLVMRTFPTATATSARGGLIFENSRGNETTPVALATNDLIGELSATGYATNGWVGDYVTATPGTAYFTATETWVNTGGPYPTAGTVTNAGTGYIVSLQPTATSLATGNTSRINVLNINPQTSALRTDIFNVSDKTNNRNYIETTGTFDYSQPLGVTANLLNTNTAAGASVGITTNYRATSGGALTLPQNTNKLGNFRFNSYQDTSGTYALASQVLAEATENWTSTANGSRISFLANKQGQNWSTGHTQVATFSPETSNFSSDTFTIESNAGTDYAVLNANTAKFNVPVTTELTTTTISEGTTYTPAATVDNNISVQIDTLAGGTTVIDLASLTGNTRGASYNILVFNNTASGTPIQVKNTRINSNNLMTHTITAGDRIIINAYVVGNYATATHLVVA